MLRKIRHLSRCQQPGSRKHRGDLTGLQQCIHEVFFFEQARPGYPTSSQFFPELFDPHSLEFRQCGLAIKLGAAGSSSRSAAGCLVRVRVVVFFAITIVDVDVDIDIDENENKNKKQQYISVLQNNGKLDLATGDDDKYDGPIVRVYFPDEGNAALARRDWSAGNGVDLPSCVRFSACGGIRAVTDDLSNDCLVFFFCPKASESDMVEEILQKTELAHVESNSTTPLLTVFVNPNLVDMGVTGFGMAGRMLRERLLDPLEGTYYLRTLQWGALTRTWPSAYSIWEEDANAEGGYTLVRTLPYLPSNPEVEDIYDAVSEGKIQVDEFGNEINRKPPSALDKFGDFVNGMMRL
mmetsp:Transcript_7088/g.14623  ORF Transcript_7088/g.14623 Transcript_7088/m.14623 type:complete len:351 (+) Transcript_7088:553-1605(+)